MKPILTFIRDCPDWLFAILLGVTGALVFGPGLATVLIAMGVRL